MEMSAFALASLIPNLFRRLFGEGALSAAFVPAFVERYDGGRKEEAHALLQRLLTAMALGLGLFVVAGIGVTHLLPQDSERMVLLVQLLRITLPYLALICMAAILGAALNGMHHFLTPALAPVLLNVTMIGAILLWVRGRGDVDIVAWAFLAGGVLQLLVMIPPLLRRGVPVRPRLGLGDPSMREVGRGFLPLVFGLAAVQINEAVSRLIAWLMIPGEGAVAILYYGAQITLMPQALIGTAVATVVFPLFSSQKEGFAEVYRRSLRLVLFVAIPATVGLMILARPTVALLFEWGQLTPEKADRVAAVVALYSTGLWCFCANAIQVRAFYAKKDMKTPVRISATMVLLNLGMVVALARPMGEAGIALANGVTGLVTLIALDTLLRRKHGTGGIGAGALARMAVSAGIMGGAVWGAHRLMAGWEGDTIGPRLVLVLVPVAVGGVVYFLVTRLLGLNEASRLLRRRHENS